MRISLTGACACALRARAATAPPIDHPRNSRRFMTNSHDKFLTARQDACVHTVVEMMVVGPGAVECSAKIAMSVLSDASATTLLLRNRNRPRRKFFPRALA